MFHLYKIKLHYHPNYLFHFHLMNIINYFIYLVQRDILVQSEYFRQTFMWRHRFIKIWIFMRLYLQIGWNWGQIFNHTKHSLFFYFLFSSRQLIFLRACGSELRLYTRCCWHWPYGCRCQQNVSLHNPWSNLIIDGTLAGKQLFDSNKTFTNDTAIFVVIRGKMRKWHPSYGRLVVLSK